MWGPIPANISVWLGRRLRGKLLNCEKLYPLTAAAAAGRCRAVVPAAVSGDWVQAQLLWLCCLPEGGKVRGGVPKQHATWARRRDFP